MIRNSYSCSLPRFYRVYYNEILPTSFTIVECIQDNYDYGDEFIVKLVINPKLFTYETYLNNIDTISDEFDVCLKRLFSDAEIERAKLLRKIIAQTNIPQLSIL